jgi:phosphoribosylglycinamide formyltransferase 1
MKKIAVFASGSGSNAEKIFEKFASHPQGSVALVLTNNASAGVIARAQRYAIPVKIFDKNTFYNTSDVLQWLQEASIDCVVLAGFLLKVPEAIVQAYAGQMVNIHPALLPAYGGKGMYGLHVHEAVLAAGETVTGITIHLVNERYDEGQMLLQATCMLAPEDTAEDIAVKVQKLEHRYYPTVVEALIEQL